MAWPSPNHGPRPAGTRIALVVLHHTAMATAAAARARLCDPAAEVSAHYLVGEDGAVEALVPEDRRAWHAGRGAWGVFDNVNDVSLGIEIANPGPPGHPPLAAAAMDALEPLLRDLMGRHGIGPAGVIGHSDMAPGRKRDPGPAFDWARLARQRLAMAPGPLEPAAADWDRFVAAAQRVGYPDAVREALLDAVRLRLDPGASGPLRARDVALIEAMPPFASAHASP